LRFIENQSNKLKTSNIIQLAPMNSHWSFAHSMQSSRSGVFSVYLLR
jgi:hypothetical protein